ncbi:MAG: hypothetical protein WAL56_04010 [Candidatus Sulfotelmatobacter sp.]
MNLDGISYLDLGDSFARHDWANALNAWWSPVYPWILGIVVNLVKPSPRFEFPLVHIVNFFMFLATLAAFRFFLHRLIKFCSEPRESDPGTSPLPEWSLILLGYAIFLWTSLEVVSIYGVGPDLMVMLCICLLGGALLGLRQNPSLRRFVFFGLVLGIGYWVKTILLPLGVFSLLCSYFWKPSSRSWRIGIATAALVFLCVTTPLILLLSKQKGRFTIGETGRLNYARYVFPRMSWSNWQGEIPGGGKPVHPTRQIMTHPPVFEFDGPVPGTYPPWTDPSYWNEGVHPRFRLKPQLQVLAETIPSEVRILLREQPDLVVGVIVFALLGGQLWWAGLRKLWSLVAICLVGMAAYVPLVVNDRYLGGFVLLLFLAILAAVRLRPADQRCAAYVAVAVFITMTLSTLDLTVRYVTHHLVNSGAGPNSTMEDLAAAEQLIHSGTRPGDKVAVVSDDGPGIYWARLAKLRIVAEVGRGGATENFWDLPDERKHRVYDALATARARLVVARCPAKTVEGWEQISGTSTCVFWLQKNVD